MKLLAIFLGLLSTLLLNNCQSVNQMDTGKMQLSSILNQIIPPVFPKIDFSIMEYGAVEGGITDCSEAFVSAIEACHTAGGGRVIVPPGTYLTGAIHLLSNVNLHISKGAIVQFSTNPEKYLPLVRSRWEGIELMNYSPLIYAYDQENIAVTGEGTLDGKADNGNWWSWTGVTRFGWKPGMPSAKDIVPKLRKMGDDNVPVEERVFPEGSYLRPPFIQPYRCRNILIEGVTIINAPFWVVNPQLSENVTVRNITVRSHGPNNDGCDPESSKNVLIEDCSFDTGDDCIAIKSGRNTDGRRVNVPSENIIIRNCRMKDGHGGVVIGSEISGGIRNVFAENCIMDSPNLDCGLRIKTNSLRGGFVENVFFRNIKIGEVGDVVRINYYYSEGDAGTFTPSVRNVQIDSVTAEKCNYGLNLLGYPNSPITDVNISNCRFNNAENGNILINVRHVTSHNVLINGKQFKSVEDEMIPPAVLSILKKSLKEGHVQRVSTSIKDGKTMYRFQISNEGESNTLIISQDGKII